MNTTNIDWNRNGFEEIIGAKIESRGLDLVSYQITNDNDDVLELQINPSCGNIHLELNGAGGDELYVFMDFYGARKIRYVKYTYGPDVHNCIEIGPCTIIEGGTDSIMVTIRLIPGFSVWTSDYRSFVAGLADSKRDEIG